MAGLLMVKNNEQLDAEEAEARENLAHDMPEPIVGQLVAQIQQAWSRNKRARTTMDRELLTCLRQIKGEYSPEERALIESQGGGNLIYMMIASTKQNAAAAWLQDVLLPADDLPVGVEPTPMPDLPGPVYSEMVRGVQQQLQAEAEQEGRQPQPHELQARLKEVEQYVKQRVTDAAKERAEGMTLRLHDILEEGGLRKALEDFIEDVTTYPTAVLKGPIYRTKPKIEWGAGWQPTVKQELQIEVERVSPFDCYPSPDAETCEDGDFIERMRMSRKQLYGMRDRTGYDQEAIDRVLRDEVSGHLKHWIWTEQERRELENKEDWWTSEPGTIDALHYWGQASGLSLMQWGMTGKIDALREYDVEAILIGHEVIRCVINDDPFGRRPYQTACFRRRPGAFWGDALPYLVRNTEKMCNSVARSLADNLAISSGPQVIVNVDAMADGEEVTNLYPWKIHQVSYDPAAVSGNTRPIDFYQPSANANELMAVFEKFEMRADDECAIPRYTYGNEKVGGAGSTASGLSMLFDATAKGIRKIIGHIDAGVMRPLVEKVWMDEMRFGTDPSIKGDCRVVARGATALLIKDQAQMRRQDFLQRTANPIDMGIIGTTGRAEVLREIVKSLDMDPDKIIPKRDEIEQREKAQSQQRDPEAELDAKQLEFDQQKAAEEAKRKLAELQMKKKEQDRRFKLDTARWLKEEEERAFQRTMGLDIPEQRVA